jgi:hypothetical protein
MWKSVLNCLLEGLAMTEPIGAVYYIASRRDAEAQSSPTHNQASSESPTRLIDKAPWVGKEASA